MVRPGKVTWLGLSTPGPSRRYSQLRQVRAARADRRQPIASRILEAQITILIFIQQGILWYASWLIE